MCLQPLIGAMETTSLLLMYTGCFRGRDQRCDGAWSARNAFISPYVFGPAHTCALFCAAENNMRRQSDFPALQNRCASTSASSSRGPLNILGEDHATDDYTNIPSSILSRLAPSPTLPYSASHPLALLRSQIEGHFGPSFDAIAAPSPVVTTQLNFEDLGFPADHPGRSPTDTYYVNRSTCLRTHTSAHEVQTFARGHTHWLLTADVYRRDEIDSSHYPIFHQMEGAAIFSSGDYAQGGRVQRECEEMEARLAQANLEIEDKVDVEEAGGWQAGHNPEHAALAMRHLKGTLNGLVLELFGERHRQETAAAAAANSSSGENASSDPLRVRWISATFPFTSPSFEVEVWFRGKWLEILGCGVVKERTLDSASEYIAYGSSAGIYADR